MNTNNSTQNTVGTITTFYDLFNDPNEGFDRVVIPKIQRDYAQGRDVNAEIRRRFLSTLFGTIDNDDSKPIELDFVYGRRTKTPGDRCFYPIDGQQRLTTLFLLHLYVSRRAGEEAFADADFLSKFSYETRDSCKKFCKHLVDTAPEKFDDIVGYLRDQWWFTSEKMSDPTISGMLNTLGDIHQHYMNWTPEKMQSVWIRLKKNITFWRLYLDDLQTTDDLYIKMNSRGKPLTSFEHFKAEVESYTHVNDEFSKKIDTEWTNLLWAYRDKNKDADPKKYMDNGLDVRFINLFCNFMILEGLKQGTAYGDLIEKSPLELADMVLKPNPKLIGRFTRIMDFFCTLGNVKHWFEGIFTTESYEYSQDHDRIYLSDFKTFDILELSTMDGRRTLRELLFIELFFEYSARTQKWDIHEEARIVRNLAFNSPDEIREPNMQDLISIIDVIVADGRISESIIKTNGNYRQRQKELEGEKRTWMDINPNDAQLLLDLENHSLIRGNGEIFKKNETFDVKHMQLFKDRFQPSTDSKGFFTEIERAMLTCGDYAPFISSRWLYGGTNWDKWRDEVFANVNQNPDLRNVLFDMLDAYAGCKTIDDVRAETERRLDAMADEKQFTWPYYMARYSGMRHTESGRYADRGNSNSLKYNRQMMNRSQFNGKNWNPYLFCIQRELDNVADLEEYDALLLIPSKNLRIRAEENSFVVLFPDGASREYKVPKNAVSSMSGIDAVDRIEWFKAKIEELIKD